MYKKIQPHIAYQSLYPFFFPIKVASDGYRRGYVSFAHFLLYLTSTCIRDEITLYVMSEIIVTDMKREHAEVL